MLFYIVIGYDLGFRTASLSKTKCSLEHAPVVHYANGLI